MNQPEISATGQGKAHYRMLHSAKHQTEASVPDLTEVLTIYPKQEANGVVAANLSKVMAKYATSQTGSGEVLQLLCSAVLHQHKHRHAVSNAPSVGMDRHSGGTRLHGAKGAHRTADQDLRVENLLSDQHQNACRRLQISILSGEHG